MELIFPIWTDHVISILIQTSSKADFEAGASKNMATYHEGVSAQQYQVVYRVDMQGFVSAGAGLQPCTKY
jgi:hypothetical protein